MVRISKYLYIHMTTIILFVICFFTRQLESMAIAYFIMLVHELSHLAAALFIGLKPARIAIYPFGINLKLKNKMIYSFLDEVILYAAGPLSNICMALASLFFFDKIPYSYDFYIQNIVLFVFNMLPIVPLDGGIIAKKIIAHNVGYKKADKIMKIISIAVVCMLGFVGIYMSVIKSFNYSVCFICIFLICNIAMSKEKYNIDFLRELIYSKENKGLNKKVKLVAVDEDADLKKVISEFAERFYYIAVFINKKGRITQMMTESEIIEILSKSK